MSIIFFIGITLINYIKFQWQIELNELMFLEISDIIWKQKMEKITKIKITKMRKWWKKQKNNNNKFNIIRGILRQKLELRKKIKTPKSDFFDFI